ncbi:MAG TPA: tyrosine-protein phosphatase [Thermoflexales bacterium]|nr:tyrosine-protein phosphatase [Thermoflexales bacterium]HQW34296.1 tyrosine-protein phosphatase [Thermoflexales bacterium]HQZ21790.1 tyrosine-protein phosphatase [Thermoflexales bacterium]
MQQRILNLEALHNARDLGGLLTRDGRRIRPLTLMRSDSTQRLTPDGERALAALGARSVLDIRTNTEVRQEPSALDPAIHTGKSLVAYRHIPMVTDWKSTVLPSGLEEAYRWHFRDHQEGLFNIFSALADGALPALVHCAAGKDRTGIVIMLALALCDVPDEAIAHDYEMTRELYAPLKPYFMEIAARDGYDLEAYERMLDCRAEVMYATLEHLRQHYGGAEDFLRMIGLSQEQLNRLKQALVQNA